MSNKLDLDYLFTLININTVVGSKVQLQKRGSNWWGLCPFHNDQKPSMSVNEQKGIFKCFSCGVSGNAVGFLQKLENIPFMQALKEALTISGASNEVLNNLNQNFKITKDQKILMINKHAMKLMHDYLLMNLSDPLIASFIQKRKLSIKMIERFNLGYISLKYHEEFYASLIKYSQENFKDDIPDDLVLDTGLFLVDNQTKKVQLFFKNRIIFPILNKNGDVVGFSGRELVSGNAKYLNSSENSFFKKGDILYNYDAINSLENVKEIILVEGYFDCITLVENGFLTAVATMGTSLTINQQKLIFSLKKLQRIVLSFDNDEPGKDAFIHNLSLLLNYEQQNNLNIPIYLSGLHLSTFKDPDELFKAKNQGEAKTIFSQYENGLLAAAKFTVDENNLEFTLNKALEFLVQYEDKFVISYTEAIDEFKKYVFKKFNISDGVWNKLLLNAKNNKPEQFVNNNYINNFEIVTNNNFNIINRSKEQTNILLSIVNYIRLLNSNYKALIALLFYYPHQIHKIVTEIKEYEVNDLLNNDQKFRKLIREINKFDLKGFLGQEYVSYYSIFAFFAFIPYVYIEYFDMTKYYERDFEHNRLAFLNSKNFKNALQSDEELEEGRYLFSNIEVINFLVVRKAIEEFKNDDELRNKINKLLNNTYSLMETIRALLLRAKRN